MKKSIQENFTRKEIASIATAYAQGKYTYFHFHQQYGYESHVFYKILRLAVEKRIVSETVARQMQKTAVANSSQKAKENYSDPKYVSYIANRVFRAWQRRIEAAKNFRFSKKEAQALVTNYSKSKLSFNEFCQHNCIEETLFRNTVIDAIIYNWVNDECFNTIYEKELTNGNTEDLNVNFLNLLKKRNENKTSK